MGNAVAVSDVSKSRIGDVESDWWDQFGVDKKLSPIQNLMLAMIRRAIADIVSPSRGLDCTWITAINARKGAMEWVFSPSREFPSFELACEIVFEDFEGVIKRIRNAMITAEIPKGFEIFRHRVER